jgi:hypothetical protein
MKDIDNVFVGSTSPLLGTGRQKERSMSFPRPKKKMKRSKISGEPR